MLNLGDLIDDIIEQPLSASGNSQQDSRGTASRGSSSPRRVKPPVKEIQKERNRQASKRNRDKQRERMMMLEETLKILREENVGLKIELKELAR
mmetsp:Transcript_6247/g.15179  ORF Transcript_6247/g.15179 Transcript_6247/m.15179 type:complete len:94 (+) Transcript_6247:193-474(+)